MSLNSPRIISIGKSRAVQLALASFAVLATTALTPPSQANEFPAVIPLSSLDGVNGFRLDGFSRVGSFGVSGGGSGWQVGTAGDVNGDGIEDLLVSAPFIPVDRINVTGEVYVVFGKLSGFSSSFDLSTLDGSNGFAIKGIDGGDQIGKHLDSAGDVNGDGFGDIIIGSYDANSNAGETYVVFGKAANFAPSLRLADLNGSNGFRLDGISPNDFSGISVAGAGDVNGDGFDEVIVGAHGAGAGGEAYVVYGKAAPFAASMNFSEIDGSNGFRLVCGSNHFCGFSVAGAGDVNGDSFADLIIGDHPANSFRGSSYVVFGKASNFASSSDLSTLNGTNGFRVDGIKANDWSGHKVNSAGDVDGNGYGDIIISAALAGESYIVFGKPSGFAASMSLSALDGTNGFRLEGVMGNLDSVSTAGDINADGFSDVIIGNIAAAANAGRSYVMFGKASGFAPSLNVSSLDGTNGFRLDGVDPGDWSGIDVGSGDFNGDGFSDLIVGAPNAKPVEDGSLGESYVVFGRAPDSPRTRVGSAAGQYISGGRFADRLNGLGGGDAVEGRGGGDALIGGPGSDAASYQHATRRVTASLADSTINSGEAAGDSYNSIENLLGSGFADKLTGNGRANRITGGPGADLLTGGAGGDVFSYARLDDSPKGSGRDRIADFNAGTPTTFVDRIDLSAIDAKTGPGNQAFTFIGTAAFSNVKGQLRVQQAGTTAVITGDVNGDAIADFEIDLLNFTDLTRLTSIDFIR